MSKYNIEIKEDMGKTEIFVSDSKNRFYFKNEAGEINLTNKESIPLVTLPTPIWETILNNIGAPQRLRKAKVSSRVEKFLEKESDRKDEIIKSLITIIKDVTKAIPTYQGLNSECRSRDEKGGGREQSSGQEG